MTTKIEAAITNNIRKFLFWFRYDGSKFASMAKGADPRKGPSVIQTVESCLQKLFGREQSDKIKTYVISRTDAKVHAIRSPILIGLPSVSDWFSHSELARTEFSLCFNTQIYHHGLTDAIELLHVDPVAQGFHPSFHVAYRRYVYRLRVITTEQSLNYPKRFFALLSHVIPKNDPSLEALSEFNYSWTVPPTFNIERAQFVCDLLRKPGQNFASFFLHPMRLRILDKDYKSVTRRRQLMLLQIKKGEPYHESSEDEAQFYNLEFVAHGFMRQQIRRMVALIVKVACDTSGSDPRKIYNFLVNDPDPLKFHKAHLNPAPPSGLFLADVVYDPRMFTNPIPGYLTPWDFEYFNEDECADVEKEELEESDSDEPEKCAEIGSL